MEPRSRLYRGAATAPQAVTAHSPHRRRVFHVIVGILALAVATVDAQTCGFDGYDFSEEFTGQLISVMDTQTGYTGEVTPCGVPSDTSACDGTQTSKDMANQVAGTYCYKVIAKNDNSGDWKYMNGKDHEDGIVVSYQNGDLCPSGSTMTMDLIFQCNTDPGVQPAFTFLDGFNQCQTQFIVPSELACSSPSGGALSGGWIFTIIVLVSIVLYVIIGCVYKARQKGTSGMESMPNVDFWREVPGLAKDGCKYTMEKIRGKKYENLDEESF